MSAHGLAASLKDRLEGLDSIFESPRHCHRGSERDGGFCHCHVISLVSIRITSQLELANRIFDLTQRTKCDSQGMMGFSQPTMRCLSCENLVAGLDAGRWILLGEQD